MNQLLFLITAALLALGFLTAPGAAAQETNAPAPAETQSAGQPPPTPPPVRNLREYRDQHPEFNQQNLPRPISAALKIRDYAAAKKDLLGIRPPKTETDRQANLAKAKEFAKSLLNRLKNQLSKVKTNIQNANMNEERRARLITQIDAALNKIEELMIAVDNAATAADLKKLVNRVRAAAQNARFTLKHHLGLTRASELQHAIEQYQTLINRLEKTVAELKNKGIDTAGPEAALDWIKSRLSNLRTSAGNTEQAYEILTESDNFDAASQSAESVTSQNRTALKAILGELRTLVRQIKSLKP